MPRQTVFLNVHSGLLERVLIQGLIIIVERMSQAHSSRCLVSTHGLVLASETKGVYQTLFPPVDRTTTERWDKSTPSLGGNTQEWYFAKRRR